MNFLRRANSLNISILKAAILVDLANTPSLSSSIASSGDRGIDGVDGVEGVEGAEGILAGG